MGGRKHDPGRVVRALLPVLAVATLIATGCDAVPSAAPAATCTTGGSFTASGAGRRNGAAEGALYATHNFDRGASHLPPLTYDSQLSDVAAAYAAVEAAQGRWGHACNLFAFTSPSVRVVNENLAYTRGLDAGAINALFMASPGHRANILDARVHYLGVAMLELPDGATLTVVRLADAWPGGSDRPPTG
ncbi:MAG: CAP domain-containing protein [Acidimicrobiia bacterium]